MFRNGLSMTVNSLWSFLQSDVVETQWCKLVENIQKTDDFESTMIIDYRVAHVLGLLHQVNFKYVLFEYATYPQKCF
jgi:hypothetical protein